MAPLRDGKIRVRGCPLIGWATDDGEAPACVEGNLRGCRCVDVGVASAFLGALLLAGLWLVVDGFANVTCCCCGGGCGCVAVVAGVVVAVCAFLSVLRVGRCQIEWVESGWSFVVMFKNGEEKKSVRLFCGRLFSSGG